MFFTFLHFYIAKYQLKYCKIVAKIVCSKMLFPGSGRLFTTVVKVVFVVPEAAKVAHNEGLQ